MSITIRLLDEQTINKIAAGEVIENPSSVVKELIDNSLDAGATVIKIDIKQGGRTLIRVQDNGIGMDRDDAILSLQRHATSKIQDVEDLFSIDTMGFRGEAIPSIASIARFSIHTQKNNQGTYLYCEGGKLQFVEDRETIQGTCIEVKDLFFNVPVRRKFQKSPAYDASEVLKSVMRLSLANPAISFELTSDNEVTLIARAPKSNDPHETLKARVIDVLGPEFLEESLPIEASGSGIILSGFIGMPLASKPNRLSQHIFINRRPVFSPFIAECVREAYGSALPQGKFPLFVLMLEAPKDLIDINVHPQKKEVRLRHFEQFKSAIGKSIREAIFGKVPAIEAHKTSYIFNPFPMEEKRPTFTFKEEEFFEEKKPPLIDRPLFTENYTFKPTVQILFNSSDIAIIKGGLQKEEALFTLIDIKALKECILFHTITEKKNYEITPFLIPYVFTLSLDESALLKENLRTLEKSGIGIREFGDNNFCLEGLPAFFGDLDLELFIDDLLGGLKEVKGSLIEELFLKKVMHSVMRATSGNKVLPQEELQGLLVTLQTLNSRFSPTGKPIYASLDTMNAKKIIGQNV